MVVSGAAVGDGGGGSSGVRTSAVKLKSYEHWCEAVHESVSCCGDMSMSRLTRDLNQNIEHATSFLTLFGSISLNLRLSNLSSLASACIGLMNGH